MLDFVGIIALFPANAIADAAGVTRLDGPVSACRVWRALQGASP